MDTNISQDKLRIAIILESNDVPAWIYSVIREINASPSHLQPVIFVAENTPGIKIKKLYQAIYAFAKKKAKIKNDALAVISEDLVTGNASITRIRPHYSANSFELNESDIETISSCKPHVILHLGCFQPTGKILHIAEKGLWTFGFLANRLKTGLPDGFSEFISLHSIFEIYLKCVDSANHYVYKSRMQIRPFSIPRNRNRLLWKSAAMAVQFLNKLHYNDKVFFSDNMNANTAENISKPGRPFLLGSLMVFLFFGIRYGFVKKIFKEQWILLYKRSEKADFDLATFKKILPPADRFWADPHVIFRNNTHYIFVEELIFKKKKAHISFLTLDMHNNVSTPQQILEKDFHLSYPFIFEWLDELYMIPETSGNKTIEIYKCTAFPEKWEFHKYLMKDIAAGDVTLFFHNNLWWLFANVSLNDGYPNWDDLYLFHSDNPFSDKWTEHPMNPVISDVSRSRPAGRIYMENDRIYRPSQDSSLRYGYGININEIIILNEKEYSEKTVKRVLPDWDKSIKRVHTLNHDAQLTIADAKRSFIKYF